MPPGTRLHPSVVMIQTRICLVLIAGGWPFSLSLSAVVQASQPSLANFPTFIRNDTVFEHLALHPDPSVGWVYIGAQDLLFQLNQFLLPNLQEETGPVTDSQDCLPPVTESNCPQAKKTNNHNKLLLINLDSEELITCGSVNQGICQKRDLNLINKILFSTERPVDTQYVAANHPNVSTVGIVVHSHLDRQPVLFVGRGYTNSHPPISTRNLAEEPIFSYEETAKLAVAGRLSEYDHHFVAAFAHSHHVYFLFYRRDLKSQSREYRTYISRICLGDQAYYSYVEVPLTCRSRTGKIYNLLQAVQLGSSTDGTGSLSSDIFLGVFSTNVASSAAPSEDSALCMFNLKDVDHRINSTRDLCYTQMGREAGVEAAYIEYEVKSNCANLPQNTLDAYSCGSDHTPSPMASRVAVEVETILDSPSARLTAVAVSMKVGHTIAFLGDSKGNLHKDGGCSRTQRSRECPPCWKREGLRQSLLHQELLQTHTLEEYWDLGRELYARQPGLVCDAWSGALHLLTCLGYHHGAHVETADMPTLLERKCCNQEPNHRVRPLPHFSLFCLDEGNLRIHRRYREDLMVVRPAREPGDDDREYRHAAYRHFIFWQHGALTRHPQLLCVGDQGQVPRPLRAV